MQAPRNIRTGRSTTKTSAFIQTKRVTWGDSAKSPEKKTLAAPKPAKTVKALTTSIKMEKVEEELGNKFTPIKYAKSFFKGLQGYDSSDSSSSEYDGFVMNKVEKRYFASERLGYRPVALQNNGNTCYMNCILQCLFACQPLNKYFLEDFTVSSLSDQIVFAGHKVL